MSSCRPEAGRLAPALLLLAAIGLTACSAGQEAASTAPAPPPPPAAAAAAAPAAEAAKPPAKPVPPPGLTPLATPQQVVDSIAVGRPDPFAPSQLPPGPDGKPAGTAAKPTLPDGFKLTGVIRTGGRAQAFVQIGDQSGPLCPGPRGRCSGAGDDQPLLPPGWSVTGIDAANGLLALSFGRQRQVIPLAP
jgi:hypothetical protein